MQLLVGEGDAEGFVFQGVDLASTPVSDSERPGEPSVQSIPSEDSQYPPATSFD